MSKRLFAEHILLKVLSCVSDWMHSGARLYGPLVKNLFGFKVNFHLQNIKCVLQL